MSKKGFTLVEMLVVVLIISIVAFLYKGSHDKGVQIRRNERARAMFLELTNAARLHNEMHPEHKIVGGFGQTNADTFCTDCVEPCYLFKGFSGTVAVNVDDYYALNPRTWGMDSAASCGSSIGYDGYNFYLCNPNFTGSQPNTGITNQCTDGSTKYFAVMTSPDNAGAFYTNKIAFVMEDYSLSDNYDD